MYATMKQALLAGMFASLAAAAEGGVVKQVDPATGITSYSYTQRPPGHHRSKHASAPLSAKAEPPELPERAPLDAARALGEDVAAAAVRAASIAAAIAAAAASTAGTLSAWVADKSAVTLARAASGAAVVAAATSSWVADVSRRMAPIRADAPRMAALSAAPAAPVAPPRNAPFMHPLAILAVAQMTPPAATANVAVIEPARAQRQSSPRRTGRATYSPPDFPRIDPATQRARDNERLIILKEELQTEQMAMNDAISNNAASATVQRHEAVIAALQREIGTVK
jgi:hypothetical protein